MIDPLTAILALRGRALDTAVCTTGSTTLSATASGYARAAGSFVTDGFRVGMELLASGFATDGYAVVESVTALTLGIAGGRTVEAADAGRTLAVGLPEGRAWENTRFEPVAGRPYIEESFVPATTSTLTFPASCGRVEETGLYVLRWYGLTNTGVAGIRACVRALLARFDPGTGLHSSGGTTLRVRADLGPFAGQALRVDGGWTVVTLNVPWLARSINGS